MIPIVPLEFEKWMALSVEERMARLHAFRPKRRSKEIIYTPEQLKLQAAHAALLESVKDYEPPKGKEYNRSRLLKSKYNISQTHWDAMFQGQGLCCAICKSPEPRSKTGWHTDHCHVSGRLRAILCQPCNLALGLFKDNVKVLEAAIKYLEFHTYWAGVIDAK